MAPTDLSIVRHGIAEDGHPDHPGDDHWRRLTPRGADRVRDSARGMLRMGVRPELIFASPHVRAAATAEILNEVLSPPLGLTTAECLAMTGSQADVLSVLRNSSAGSVCLVGHNPSLSELVSELTASGRLRLRLKKASLVHIRLFELPRGFAGELAAYIPPRVLRAAAR